NVSSTTCGSPHRVPVAPARTYSQRGVMTATPKETSLGFTRWTRGRAELGGHASAAATLAARDALRVMWLALARRIRRSCHVPFVDFELWEDRPGVIAVDLGAAAARELCGPKRGNSHELECAHSVRRTDHRATPKKVATRTPI